MANRNVVLTGLFGVLVFVGGLIGFVKSGSVMSFAFGLVFGLTLAVAAYLMNDHTTRKTGHRLSSVTLGGLTLVMLYRYTLAFKFMPAGLVALLAGSLFIHNLASERLHSNATRQK